MRKVLLVSRFFDPKRYDLANVGRYKINKKLHIKNRLFNQRIAETLVDPETGEIIAEAGQCLIVVFWMKFCLILKKDIGFKTFTSNWWCNGADDIPLQSINVYAPIDRR